MPLELLHVLAAGWMSVLRTPLSQQQLDQFARYAELLVTWNERVNLTAITDAEGIVTKHFLDSLSVLVALDPVAQAGTSLIDVGTGAGFPGLPLAIVRPAWRVTLLEATRKKVDFLQLVVDELALDNVRLLWGRAEEQGQESAQREQYDVAVARAVADLPVLAEYCLPFVRVGGRWVAQKGPRVDEEVQNARNALGQLGGRLVGVESISIPGLAEQTRSLVIVDKIKSTPATFPRRTGTPGKRPL